MNTIVNILVGIIGSLHVWFLILEMFLWRKPIGLKTFGMNQQKADDSAVLAANQGLYNGFLAAGLFWGLSLCEAPQAQSVKVFFLSCVAVAGLYGAYSVSRKILFIQALPALIALGLFLF